jgi:hypothetical protein
MGLAKGAEFNTSNTSVAPPGRAGKGAAGDLTVQKTNVLEVLEVWGRPRSKRLSRKKNLADRRITLISNTYANIVLIFLNTLMWNRLCGVSLTRDTQKASEL